MSLDILIETIQHTAGELVQKLESGERQIGLGLRRAARLPVLVALHLALNRPILLITSRADAALTLADELALWAPDAPRLFVPEPTPLFYENAAWGEVTRHDRLVALTTLAAYHIPGTEIPPVAPILIAPARAIMTRTLPRRDFLKAARALKPGQSVQPDNLARQWVSLGYEPVNTVILPGQFARRGGILDVWPPADPQPSRIEFFGDEIDTLRHFEPATQITIKTMGSSLHRLLVTPAREYILREGVKIPVSPSGGISSTSESEGAVLDTSSIIAELLGEQPPGEPEAEVETSTTGEVLPEEIGEFHIPLLHPTPASLLDYLPPQALVLVDDLQTLRDTVSEVEEQAVGLRRDFIEDGTLPPDFPIPYITLAEIEDLISTHQAVELGMSGALENEYEELEEEEEISGDSLAGHFAPGPRFGGRLKLLMDELTQRYSRGEGLVIVSRQSPRLQELWEEARQGGQVAEADSRRFPAPLASNPVFFEGSLTEGWIFTPPVGPPLSLLTDGEIFGWRRPEPRYKRSGRYPATADTPETAFADLQVGDWVVHVDHGIGRFLGLVSRKVDGMEREYLCVEYAENDQLFVPVYQADRLTRYVGPDSRTPSPTRLGGGEWKNARSRAEEAVEEVAEDLLDLYAQRQVVTGYSFSADTAWQQELEASFPYVETEDQLRVIGEVKRDMESSRPMDRLICGDVGYGKTEVALRAAFKAVMAGKQVAVLVPTTVLAQQHFNTFRERLAAFPVEVEMLSRFRTHQQQRGILYRLAQGNIDIIIGTHRMLQEDVQIKDLGLLIIDEEQRFGVTHKETFKQMRTEVDVLTLTATPIPRTLYMALTGVRDISNINTPPEERLPIVTHVGPYSQRLVRQAILRELERNGQVFFVHNRVQTIEAMHRHLEKLVPEARITVAHGQMHESELSQRMEEFTRGEVDILLCTSIIESGLDIPNANTLIVDRADTFGLAQLYQLRGRVGRGAQRAYAYFFRHRRRLPTLEGRQRLETIAENTQLGAGYSIAMRDLEIRGAGDLLGMRQSGHIAAVGFHLYTRLLADAVKRMRGESPEAEALPAPTMPMPEEVRMPVNVDLPLNVGIPADYVSDKNMRLRLYRRIASLRSFVEVEALVGEFADRFGPVPETLKNLLYQMKVKLLAESVGLASVSGESSQIVLRYPPLPEGMTSRSFPFTFPEVRAGKNALWMQSAPGWQEKLLEVLDQLAELGIKTEKIEG